MVVRDPVHGDIALTEAEVRVLDSPSVQRLRGIKQTGTAYLVFPGCVHTRFDHSLGTLAAAKRILARLEEDGLRVDREAAQAVALAALLHDVTHVPFGHTLEDERHLFPRHDAGPRLERLLAGELGEVLAGLGFREAVSRILHRRGTPGAGGAGAFPAWMAQVVSSTIDADLLDYLRRDSRFAGLAHDYDERIYRYFTVEGGELALDLTRGGMERPDARSEVLQLLRTRYFLTERVYFHHTKVCSGAMIAKAVELALERGFREEDLLDLGDETLLRRLRDFPPGRPDPRIARLAAGVERRRLLKRGYVISAAGVDRAARAALVRRYRDDAGERRRAEEALARALGLGFEQVVLYCSGLSSMKEAAALVRTGRGLGRLNDPAADPPSELRVLEEQYEALWRLYVFVPEAAADRCRAAAAELLGYPSEY